MLGIEKYWQPIDWGEYVCPICKREGWKKAIYSENPYSVMKHTLNSGFLNYVLNHDYTFCLGKLSFSQIICYMTNYDSWEFQTRGEHCSDWVWKVARDLQLLGPYCSLLDYADHACGKNQPSLIQLSLNWVNMSIRQHW